MNFGEQSFAEEMSAAVLSFALAVLTYRFVELPVRRLRKNRKLRLLPLSPWELRRACWLPAWVIYGRCVLRPSCFLSCRASGRLKLPAATIHPYHIAAF